MVLLMKFIINYQLLNNNLNVTSVKLYINYKLNITAE